MCVSARSQATRKYAQRTCSLRTAPQHPAPTMHTRRIQEREREREAFVQDLLKLAAMEEGQPVPRNASAAAEANLTPEQLRTLERPSECLGRSAGGHAFRGSAFGDRPSLRGSGAAFGKAAGRHWGRRLQWARHGGEVCSGHGRACARCRAGPGWAGGEQNRVCGTLCRQYHAPHGVWECLAAPNGEPLLRTAAEAAGGLPPAAPAAAAPPAHHPAYPTCPAQARSPACCCCKTWR